MRDPCIMSQNAKGKGGKKSKDNDSSQQHTGEKINRKFRFSFRGNKSKKDNKDKMTKGEDDEECILGNNISSPGDYQDYEYSCNNNNISNAEPKIDFQREFSCDNKEVVRKNEENIADCRSHRQDVECVSSEINEPLYVINEILNEIFDVVVPGEDYSDNNNSAISTDETDSVCKQKIELRRRVDSEDNKLKASNRRTSIADENIINYKFKELSRRDSLYSVEEYDEDLDENENYHDAKTVQAVNQVLVNRIGNNNLQNHHHNKPEGKKKSFLNTLFGRNKKDKKPEQSTKSKNLMTARKYSSTFELSQKLLEKSPSFIRKSIRHVVNKDVPSLLKRSFSVRDVEKKKERSRERLTDMKKLEWAKSLQSLVENDNSVSYDDMSFINYDTLNTASYELPRPALNLHRTQSLIVHVSVFVGILMLLLFNCLIFFWYFIFITTLRLDSFRNLCFSKHVVLILIVSVLNSRNN